MVAGLMEGLRLRHLVEENWGCRRKGEKGGGPKGRWRASGDSQKLYRRLFRFYGGLLAGVVILLTVYFLSMIRGQVLEGQMENTAQLLEEAAGILERSEDSAAFLQADLYQSPQELWDLIHYLTDDQETYLEYRLDNYPETGAGAYRGCEAFFRNAMASSPYLERVEVLSGVRLEKTAFGADGSRRKFNLSRDYLLRLMSGQESIARQGEFAFLKELKNPATFETVGCVIYTFQTGQFTELLRMYPEGRLFLYHENGITVFMTEPLEPFKQLMVKLAPDPGRELKARAEEAVVENYHILSYLPDARAGRIPTTVFLLILLIALAVLLGGLFLIRRNLKGLERRLDEILAGMRQVTKGNLQVALKSSPAEDELDLIAGHFNTMCRQLEEYIQKSYLAQIEQKNAEMAALQSQINPHFLYNTLEAIRMRAICNGDREVGKMLYSMAVMFRSQLKEADVITLAQELHYTKKYLELFEYRYQGRFSSEVECPEELMDVQVIKFILQPVVENYFVHGIRMEDEDNRLRITAIRTGPFVRILAEDNGRGMRTEEIEAENAALQGNHYEKGKSIGLANVNLRLKAAYGEDCGVSLDAGEMGGVRVVLTLKPEQASMRREGGWDEESSAGRR